MIRGGVLLALLYLLSVGVTGAAAQTPADYSRDSAADIDLSSVITSDIEGIYFAADGSLFFGVNDDIYRRLTDGTITTVATGVGVSTNPITSGLVVGGGILYAAYFGTKAHAYTFEAASPYAAGSDQPLAHTFPYGIWTDGTTLWTLNFDGDVSAQTISTSLANDSLACDLGSAPTSLHYLMWSDGTTVWVGELSGNAVYAYTAFPDCQRDSSKDLTLPALFRLDGIAGTGSHLYIAMGQTLLAYRLPNVAPDVPENVRLDGSPTYTAATLLWDAAAYATSYVLQWRDVNTQAWSAELEVTQPQASLSSLHAGGTFLVRVKARKSAGDSAHTDPPFSFTTAQATGPATPDPPIVTALSETSLRVRWTAVDDGGASPVVYALQYRAAFSTTWIFVDVGADILTHDIEMLDSETEYLVQVMAENSVDASDWSDATRHSTHGPAPPPTVAATVTGGGSHMIGAPVAFELSFGDLPPPASPGAISYLARITDIDLDVQAQCEGAGTGMSADIDIVDQNPEVRTVFSSATCAPGSYLLGVTLTVHGETYSTTVGFAIVDPTAPVIPEVHLLSATPEGFRPVPFADPAGHYWHGSTVWIAGAVIVALFAAAAAPFAKAWAALIAVFIVLFIGVIVVPGISVELIVMLLLTTAAMVYLFRRARRM